MDTIILFGADPALVVPARPGTRRVTAHSGNDLRCAHIALRASGLGGLRSLGSLRAALAMVIPNAVTRVVLLH